ncbi:MAG: hypothetical protein GAK39_01977 [Variovorax sp.]|nr:MAG: hypothetical protein GAK39_01977 [Variovorax sp.]
MPGTSQEYGGIIKHGAKLRFHFGQAHRAAAFQVLAQRLGRTHGHVGQDLVAHFHRTALERDDQRLGHHFAQHQLHRAVVQFDQVVEHEHLVHDLLGQVRVVVADGVQHGHVGIAAEVVDHLGRRLDAAQRGLADLVATGQHLEQHFVEVLERGRLNAFQRGHAQHDFAAKAFGQLHQHGSSLLVLQVHQDGGHDLRMLAAQQFGHRQRVHPFQAFDAGDIAALQDAVDQQRGLVVAQGALEHRAHIAAGVVHQQALRGRVIGKAVDDEVHLLARDAAHVRNGLAELLHFLGCEVLEHLGRFLLAQGDQQDGGVVQASFVHISAIRVWQAQVASPLIQVLTMLATAIGFCLASWRACSRRTCSCVGDRSTAGPASAGRSSCSPSMALS